MYTLTMIPMTKVNTLTSLEYHRKVPLKVPPQRLHLDLDLDHETLHHTQPPVLQDLRPHLANGQVLNALHQRPIKHFLDDVLADELVQKEGIERRISGHFLKQRIIVIVVGFACEYFSHPFFNISVSVRHQKEEGKSVPFHEYAGKGTDSLHNHLINHHR